MTAPSSALLRVTGATRVFGIVGDPIVQARSPEVYCERFAAEGMNAVMIPLQVSADDFDTVMPGLMRIGNLDGLLIMAPHKSRMTAFADRLGTTAQCIGAVNALRRDADGSWSADMFDGEGFAQGVLAKGERLQGRDVLLFGAGGAGSAIACALAAHGVASIRIVNPDAERTATLVNALGASFPACNIAAATDRRTGFDMVVNASPVGMKPGDGLPGDIGVLTPDMLVGDVVVSAEPTAIVRQAQLAGSRWFNGHDMHSGQIAALTQFLVPATSSQVRLT